MPRTYYTLCIWDADAKDWFDVYGDYIRANVVAETEAYDVPKTWMRILHTDGTAADLLAWRDAMDPPKGQSRAN